MGDWTAVGLSPAAPVILLRDWVAGAVAVLLTASVCAVSRRYPEWAARVAARFQSSLRHARLYVLAAAILPVALRLALLPWLPPPEPQVHDEFGHLLVADTLASGRLANPPHPLWRHLETIYVLQQPNYASVYPLGQAIPLAAGQFFFGVPWAGVLLSAGLMCGAIAWMLFGCLPPAWAAIGGLLAAAGYGLAPLWVNSYWGGAFCAFGGALLFGALSRLRQGPSRGMALAVGFGWSVMWLVRPFEALFAGVVMWGVVLAFITLGGQQASWRSWIVPAAAILAVQLLAGCVTALHNRAVTGSATALPYRLSQRAYGVPQSMLWQAAATPPALRAKELKAIDQWHREAHRYARAHPVRWFGRVLHTHLAWVWAVAPWYSLALLLLVCLWKDPLTAFASALMLGALAFSAQYPFYFPHYTAAYSCVMAFLVTRGLMRLSACFIRGRAVGRLLALFLTFGGFALSLRIVPARAALGLAPDPMDHYYLPQLVHRYRPRVSERLMASGDRHVVFIRYGPGHSPHDEWVYNAAQIDASPIVWCRAGDRESEAEVIRYYAGRRSWVVTVDWDSVRLRPYPSGRPAGSPAAAESWDWLRMGPEAGQPPASR